MAGLITDLAGKAGWATFFTALVTGILPDTLDTIGDNRLHTGLVYTFYVFCGISLFAPTRYRLFYVLALPVFTQFLHLFQKYTFPLGANSIWRLLPFMLLDLYFAHFFTRKRIRLTRKERWFLWSWLVLNGFYLGISDNLEGIYLGGGIILLITLPAFYLYLRTVFVAVDFRVEIERYLFLLFIILGAGTFGLVVAGARYKGAVNLLVTRNISDTNVTMAYFMLLWPFVIYYLRRVSASFLTGFAVVLLFLGVVALSFSRGAVFLVVPYLLLMQPYVSKGFTAKWLLGLFILVGANLSVLDAAFEKYGLGYSWALRFGAAGSPGNFLQHLNDVSRRTEIRQIAYELFLQNPATGYGIASFEVRGPGFREAHSLWFTELAEKGVIGTVYLYFLLGALTVCFAQADNNGVLKTPLFLGALVFYLFFNHTVGSVWVILSAKSMTINCIAPLLLLCMFFYTKSESGEGK